MCGIIGYIGNKNTIPILIKGLEKLEYRGYDSAGLCVIDNKNIVTIKKKGRVSILANDAVVKKLNSNLGIAHTRWATHGEPNRVNAHPHLDCKGEIAIVHNGIIENYQALEKLLKKEGHKISSKTDSEILAHLIEKFYKNNLFEAVNKALKLVKGAYGLVVIHKNENKIIAARNGSPLVLGIGKDEMFVSSDASAIIHHTKNVIYLNDKEIAEITPKKYIIKNLNGKKVDKKIHKLTWTVDQIEKAGYKHFMLKEIFEQPQAIESALRGRIKNNQIKLTVNINTKPIKRIILLGCGTSWHSALIGKYLFEKILNLPVEVDYASEFRYRNPIISKNDLVVVISQSGETADTLAALREAKAKNAKTVGIINAVGSTIAREVDSGIYLHAGPEIGVASTKAFTCQIIVLLLLALYIRQEKGNQLDKKILTELNNLPRKIKLVLNNSKSIKQIAQKFKNSSNFLYLGRGINFPVALEGALKLKEISYIHAEGYPAAEMKHGPIALIDENMPIVFISPKDSSYNKILNNMEEIKARKGKIITIITEQDKKITKLANQIFKVPKTIDELSPIVNVISLQLLAYYIADLKNIDVDKPRNLAKSVTVE